MISYPTLNKTLDDLNIAFIELPRSALFLAGKAFVQYRRQGGTKNNVLADFFIGAHAAVAQWPILTRDARRYSTYFPSILLIAPNDSIHQQFDSLRGALNKSPVRPELKGYSQPNDYYVFFRSWFDRLWMKQLSSD